MQLPVASTLLKALKTESKRPNNEQPQSGSVCEGDGNKDLVVLYNDIKAMDTDGIFSPPGAVVWGESHPANVR